MANKRPARVATGQSEDRSDDEDAFWWRVNIGAICYWAAHWLAVVSLLHLFSWPLIGQSSFLLASDWSAILSPGLWLAAAVIPVLQCCRHRLMPPACAACCSSQDDCGTLINTHRLWWTRRICSEMRRGFDAGYVRARGSWWRQHRHKMQWLDLKWRLHRAEVIITSLTGKKKSFIRNSFPSCAEHLSQLIFILSRCFWKLRHYLSVSLLSISHLWCWV